LTPKPEQLTMNKNTPTTTFARIKAGGPCEARYKRALRKAGGLRKYGENTPITVRQIVKAMGLNDALWCLRTMPEHSARWRLFAVACARRVQHLMTDQRSLAALDVAERHARGLATDAELDAARTAAWDAAWDAARTAARSAGRAAQTAAAAAGATAAGAAAGAAEDAAGAAEAAAWAAEREWQAAELIRICEEPA
jgi:hypothetical protein